MHRAARSFPEPHDGHLPWPHVGRTVAPRIAWWPLAVVNVPFAHNRSGAVGSPHFKGVGVPCTAANWMSPCLPARLPRPHFAARPAHVRKTPLCARARAPMCVIGYSDCSARLMMADIRRRRCCEYVKRYRSMRRDDDGRRYRRTLAGRWAAFKETIFIGKTPRKSVAVTHSDRRDDGSEINGPLSPPDITEYGRTGRARRIPVIQLPCMHSLGKRALDNKNPRMLILHWNLSMYPHLNGFAPTP